MTRGFGRIVTFSLTVMIMLCPSTAAVRAPGQLISDTVVVPMDINWTTAPGSTHWHAPLGMDDGQRLERVVIYSDDGHAISYRLDRRPLDGGVGVTVLSDQSFVVPLGMSVMFPIEFMGDSFIAIAGGSLYELTADGFDVRTEVEMGFEPTFQGNLWNGWSEQNPQGIIFHAMADASTLAVFSKVPPNYNFGELDERQFFSKVNLSDHSLTDGSEIIGDPVLVRLTWEVNGSLVIVPTSTGIVAFGLDVNKTTPNGPIRDVRLGDIVWRTTYEEMGASSQRAVEPIPDHPLTLSSDDPTAWTGKDRVILACRDGSLYSLRRETGAIEWSSSLETARLVAPEPTGVWPSRSGSILVTGGCDGGGFMVGVDPTSGEVLGNGSCVVLTDGAITARPQEASVSFTLINSASHVYILDRSLGIDSEFKVPGPIASPVSIIGNVLNSIGTTQGNYFAVVMANATLRIQCLTGTYVPGPEIGGEPEPTDGGVPGPCGAATIMAFLGVAAVLRAMRTRGHRTMSLDDPGL